MIFRTKFISNSSSSSFIIYSDKDLTKLDNFKEVAYEDNCNFWDIYNQIVHPLSKGSVLLSDGTCYDFSELSPTLVNQILKEVWELDSRGSTYVYKVKDFGAQGIDTRLGGLFNDKVTVICKGFECD